MSCRDTPSMSCIVPIQKQGMKTSLKCLRATTGTTNSPWHSIPSQKHIQSKYIKTKKNKSCIRDGETYIYSETSIYLSRIIRFPGSVVQFLWSLSESYFNYGSCICFPGSIVSFSDTRQKRWIEVSLYMDQELSLCTVSWRYMGEWRYISTI
jgi:hypothetical protein